MTGIVRARYTLEFKQEAKGAAGLMIPAEVMIVESLPLLGSGKLDFAAVTKMVRERGSYILPTPRVPNGLLGRIRGNGMQAT